jgi:hypothetical protein
MAYRCAYSGTAALQHSKEAMHKPPTHPGGTSTLEVQVLSTGCEQRDGSKHHALVPFGKQAGKTHWVLGPLVAAVLIKQARRTPCTSCTAC